MSVADLKTGKSTPNRKEGDESTFNVDISIFNYIKSMIGLITHRLNNSVGIIRVLSIDLLELSDKFDEKTINRLNDIKTSAEEALRIPIELDKFIAKLNSEKRQVDIFDVIDEILSESEFPGVDFSFDALKDLPKVKANYLTLKEVFSELIKNAVKAMPEGGEITFSGKKIGSKMLEIGVKDTGHGIAKQHINKIFEYGFTKWKHAKGTGDGLAIIRTVIEVDHKGKIYVESELGKGTRIRIQLPIFYEI